MGRSIDNLVFVLGSARNLRLAFVMRQLVFVIVLGFYLLALNVLLFVDW